MQFKAFANPIQVIPVLRTPQSFLCYKFHTEVDVVMQILLIDLESLIG